MPRSITSFSNDTVKRLRSLREKKARRLEGLFLAEGLRIMAEARDAGVLPRIVACGEGELHPLAETIVAEAEAAGAESIAVPDEIMAKMSGKDNPPLLLGAYDQPRVGLADLDRSAADLWFVAEKLRDPGNIGTILRTGDAVGAGGLILVDDSADPYSVEAVRASMGAIFTQKIVQVPWTTFLSWLRSGEGQMVGTSLQTEVDYLGPTYEKPCFLLIGNEQAGLPEAYESECDLLVKIPMHGKADSLNAAVAAAVMAFQVRASWR